MINLIHAEFYKLFRSKAFYVCFLVTSICAVSLAVLANGIATGNIEVSVNTLSGLSDIFLMSVIGALMLSMTICNDFDNKNIHDAVSRGRLAIVVSKTVISVTIIALLVLPYAIVGLIGFISGAKFSVALNFSTYLTLMGNESAVAVNFSSILKSIAMLLVSLLLYAARTSFCIPIAFKVRKSVVVTVICVVFGFLCDLLMSLLSKIPGLDKLVELTPFKYQVLTLQMSAGELIKITYISVVFITLMGALTYGIFKKAEIK